MSTQTESTGPPPTGWEQRPEERANPSPPAGHPADAIRDAAGKIAELREFIGYYIAARIDALKLTARNIGIYAGLGLIGLVAGATVVVVAVVLLLVGIAGAWGALFGGRVWLGDIVTGVIFLGILAVGVLVGMRVLTGVFKTKTVHKYESRQRHQREQFGRNVRDEAERAERASAGRSGR